jgi:type I restriction enzyme, R subunit
VYGLLRYGVKVRPEVGEQKKTVWLIDWQNPDNNDFAIAEEVTVAGVHDKRPDIVLYVNGIALGVLELKRSTVSVTEGIRQNLDNQKKDFIRPFFATVQLVMARNDSEGLRYGVIETKEKHYLSWKEPSPIANPLDRALEQLCRKDRLLEILHDFIVFDAGTKKICRHNQYFGVRAAQHHVRRREGGILWHTQGSGKSLKMVWLAKWIREHVTGAAVASQSEVRAIRRGWLPDSELLPLSQIEPMLTFDSDSLRATDVLVKAFLPEFLAAENAACLTPMQAAEKTPASVWHCVCF